MPEPDVPRGSETPTDTASDRKLAEEYRIWWEPGDESDVPYMIRNVHPKDVPFVTNSWLKSFRGSGEAHRIKNTFYFSDGHKVLEEIIPQSVVVVLCDRVDPNQILGYLCYTMYDTCMVLHYVYLKAPFRKMGLASQLIRWAVQSEKPPVVFYTHLTKKFDRIARKKKGWYYRPALRYLRMSDEFLRK